MRPLTLICALFATLQILSGTALAGGGWTWPIRGPVLNSYRNGDDPYAAGQHRGVDIGAPVGARVVAAAPGTVTFAGVVGSSGLVVSERTADGRFDLSYLHLATAAVRRGDVLAEGAALGSVGTSGRRSTAAPHLHFGVREAGERSAYRDPLDFLAPPPAGGAPDPAPVPVRSAEPAPSEPVPAPATLPALGPVPAAVPGLAPAPALGAAAAPGAAPGLAAWAAPGGLAASADPSRGRPGLGAPPRVAARAPTRPAAGRGRRAAVEFARAPHGAPGPDTSARAPAARIAPAGSAAPLAAVRSHPTSPARSNAHPPSGFDAGWLVACIGLVAAAGVLGRPWPGRRTGGRGRGSIAALLRPAPRAGPGR